MLTTPVAGPGAINRWTLDEVWPDLDQGITHLLTNLTEGFSLQQYMKLYSSVHNHCTARANSATMPARGRGGHGGAKLAGAELYARLRNFLIKYLKMLLKAGETRMDDSLLNFYRKEWERYTTALRVVHKLFEYLNRHWIKRAIDEKQEGIYEVYTLSLVLWKKYLFDPLKVRLSNAILCLIDKERNNEQIDTSLVKGVIDAYVSLGFNKDKEKRDCDTLQVYQRDFSDAFFVTTEAFYANECNTFISQNTVSDYMKKVERSLANEQYRVQTYLHSSSEPELKRRCEKVMIQAHKDTIWHEFQGLLVNEKLDDISRMYGLLSRITDGLVPLKDIMEKHIQAIGDAAIYTNADAALTDPRAYVQTILDVHNKFSEIVKQSFKNDPGFVEALDKACRRFINDNAVTRMAKTSSKSPELVAKYCDILLKKSPKNPDEQSILAILTDIMLVFKYIEDKDVFQTFYSKMLAKRLINGTSASEFLEGQMITKLKQNCGFDYTAKLARMFRDMSLSRSLQDSFREQYTTKDLGVDFTILVLATGSWPLVPPSTNFNVPDELTKCRTSFHKFYSHQYTGRKLNWLTQFSKGELKTGYTKQHEYLLQCSTYQMGILLLFNQKDIWTAEDMQVATALTKPALINTLETLHKTKILVMNTQVISLNTQFKLNKEFKNKKARVLINVRLVDHDTQNKESDDTHQLVEEDRRLQIQAAIVRIMKTRKTIKHSNLVSDVILQLQSRFRPKVALIKKCIDLLIEKDYLQRDATQKDLYMYMA